MTRPLRSITSGTSSVTLAFFCEAAQRSVYLLAPLAAMFAGCRRLRRIWRNGKALFRQLLLQLGGANIAGLICSLRSLRCSLVAAVFVGSGGTEKRCSAISSCSSAQASRV